MMMMMCTSDLMIYRNANGKRSNGELSVIKLEIH